MVVSLASSPPPTPGRPTLPQAAGASHSVAAAGHRRRARERLHLRLLGRATLLVVPLEVKSAGGGSRQRGRRDEAPEWVVGRAEEGVRPAGLVR